MTIHKIKIENYIITFSLLLLACNNKNEKVKSEVLDTQKSKSKYALKVPNACGYYTQISEQVFYTFNSDAEAEAVLEKIMKLTGLPSNFIIKAANVENAAATIICTDNTNCIRYILYNQDFMQKVKDKTKTHFAEISILAHEIGHHLSGHTLFAAKNHHDQELEADKFSGFIMYKMGATLEDAQSAVNSLCSETGSISHPPKSARLAAISNGWFEAQKNNNTNSKSETNSNISPVTNRQQKPIDLKNTTHNSSNYSTYKIGNIEIMSDDLTYILNMNQDFMNWEEAKQACANLGDGWRLPTVSELKIIYKNRLKIGGFYRSNWTIYWSDNTLNEDDYIWRFDFEAGKAMYDSKRNFANVRAVRNN